MRVSKWKQSHLLLFIYTYLVCVSMTFAIAAALLAIDGATRFYDITIRCDGEWAEID